jgi:hypothetical protein
MSDRLALANAIEGAGIEGGKARRLGDLRHHLRPTCRTATTIIPNK